MLSAKIIKKKIRAVSNTKKITKTMQMISSAKMYKAVNTAQASREYSRLSLNLLYKFNDLTEETSFGLIERREVKNVMLIIFTSNKGLCGNFNTKVLKKTKNTIEEIKFENGLQDSNIYIIAIGKKAASFAKKNKYNLVAVFDDISYTPTLNDSSVISDMMVKSFMGNVIDACLMVFTTYKTSLNQVTVSRKLLPFRRRDSDVMVNDMYVKENMEKRNAFKNYYFEPSETQIINYIIPRLINAQVYQALLESSASEHSSRMLAMKNASDIATEFIEELSLEFNKSRQAMITKEISEIAAGSM